MALEDYKPSRFMLQTSHYDKSRADRAVNFIQALKHGKGKWHNTPFLLMPWQEQIVRDIFGIIKPDGMRQFNTAYIECPKKSGKSELAAAVALYMLVADGEHSGEVYSAATDRNQAGIVHRSCVELIEQNPTLRSVLKIIPSQKRIAYPKLGSFYQTLSADIPTKIFPHVSWTSATACRAIFSTS